MAGKVLCSIHQGGFVRGCFELNNLRHVHGKLFLATNCTLEFFWGDIEIEVRMKGRHD